MRKLVCLGALLLAVSISAAGQDVQKVDLFGGYTYFHAGFPGNSLNFNGGSGSLTANFTPLFGFTADFGRYDNSHSGVSSTNFTYLFGPQFTYRGNEHVTPFFHVLFGGSHLSSSFSSGGTSSSSDSSNAFAFAPGGGLDVHVSPHVAIRVAQVDYLLTKFKDDQDNRQNNVRVSAGIVFRWGGTGTSGRK
jgi:opacity protein-like surface antigen